ncbi:RGG repeats nuclear RNA binding protein A-like [Curcuma longa]|uniref:RGG repeats nuclear RNA binding protein A-like n=1 Tax=Curcuma longa TaxID=136217 RepID=UPI003D9E9C2A
MVDNDEERKVLLAMQSEERKVEFDEELQSMKQLSVKKENDEGTGKDIGKKKENIHMSITEFFKPTNGGRYYAPGGGGRGRLRGGRGQQFGGNFDLGSSSPTGAPSIEDPGQFPTLSGK